jgi:plasmid stability protein
MAIERPELLFGATRRHAEGEVRDRLAARAHAHGRSLGAELSAILDDLMWRGVEERAMRAGRQLGRVSDDAMATISRYLHLFIA